VEDHDFVDTTARGDPLPVPRCFFHRLRWRTLRLPPIFPIWKPVRVRACPPSRWQTVGCRLRPRNRSGGILLMSPQLLRTLPWCVTLPDRCFLGCDCPAFRYVRRRSSAAAPAHCCRFSFPSHRGFRLPSHWTVFSRLAVRELRFQKTAWPAVSLCSPSAFSVRSFDRSNRVGGIEILLSFETLYPFFAALPSSSLFVSPPYPLHL